MEALVHYSSLCIDLTQQLATLYRALPKVMDPIHIHSVTAKWGYVSLVQFSASMVSYGSVLWAYISHNN